MKKIIGIPLLLLVLAGCDQVNYAVDKAQEAVNDAIDFVQDKIEDEDLKKLSVDKLNKFGDVVSQMSRSINDTITLNYADQKAIDDVSKKIENAYSCLVSATSESTAEKLLAGLREKIGDEKALSLIDKSINKAKEIGKCAF
ncbi:MAG: hypothetical protein ACRCWB_01285 [Enterovibrio sp.]